MKRCKQTGVLILASCLAFTSCVLFAQVKPNRQQIPKRKERHSLYRPSKTSADRLAVSINNQFGEENRHINRKLASKIARWRAEDKTRTKPNRSAK